MKHLFFLSVLLPSLLLSLLDHSTSKEKKNNIKLTATPVITDINPQNGPYNTLVTINGSGFSNKMEENIVQINGMNAVVRNANTNQLTVVVPKSAGTGKVEVTVRGNGYSGPVFNYTYTVTVRTIPKLIDKTISGFTSGSSTTTSLFVYPKHLACDINGNIYVTDGNCIRKIEIGGRVLTFAGSDERGYVDGNGTNARFNNPMGLAIDSYGNLFVADFGNSKIRKISPAGLVSTFAFSNTDYTSISKPVDLTIDKRNNIYILAFPNIPANYCKVYKVLPSEELQGLSHFKIPLVDNSFIPFSAITVDLDGYVFMSNRQINSIYKISPNGDTRILAGGGTYGFLDASGTSAKFSGPMGLAVDSNKNVYVADQGSSRIRKIAPDGLVTTFAGTGVSGYADGIATSSQFNVPFGLAINNQGNLFVVDNGNNKIRMIVSE